MSDKTIWGGAANDTIYGDAQYLGSVQNYFSDLTHGQAGSNTIYGGAGNNTIFGNVGAPTAPPNGNPTDGGGLHGTAAMGGPAMGGHNTIYADAPNADDRTAINTIYGNAMYMYGEAQVTLDSQGWGNHIYDSLGTQSTIYGNAFSMNQDASGGHNYIVALSLSSTVYGDAQSINDSLGGNDANVTNATPEAVMGGHNTIVFDSQGYVYGDAKIINQGTFYGGWNTIWINDGSASKTYVFGTTASPVSSVYAGHNEIHAGAGTDTIHGDWVNDTGGGNNPTPPSGGWNTIYAGTGTDTVYGDVEKIGTEFTGGHNTIYAGTGDSFGLQGNADIWGGAGVDLQGTSIDTFVFKPGTGLVTIHDFDQHSTSGIFTPAQGDKIDLTAYHLTGGVVVTSDPHSGYAIINLPPTPDHPSTITLVNVTPTELTPNDFLLGLGTATPTAQSVQNDHLGITRVALPLDQATTEANAINAGTTTETAYVNSLLTQVADTTIPAVAVEASMYGAVGSSAEVTSLTTQFLPAQVAFATQHGFNPLVFSSEALGVAFAFNNENGSTAFATTFGPTHAGMPDSAAGDAAFAAAASSIIFGSASTPTLVNAIDSYVSNWKTFFANNGLHGSADQIDLAARGTAWGDAVGLALANNLGPFHAQTINFLEDAAQGTAAYSASLASQPNHAPFQGAATASLAGAANDVQLTGVAAHVDHIVM
jgi:hypothetical protein